MLYSYTLSKLGTTSRVSGVVVIPRTKAHQDRNTRPCREVVQRSLTDKLHNILGTELCQRRWKGDLIRATNSLLSQSKTKAVLANRLPFLPAKLYSKQLVHHFCFEPRNYSSKHGRCVTQSSSLFGILSRWQLHLLLMLQDICLWLQRLEPARCLNLVRYDVYNHQIAGFCFYVHVSSSSSIEIRRSWQHLIAVSPHH